MSGHPAIPLSDTSFDGEVLDAARDALASGWWSTGPRVEEFERAFADFVGSRHGVAASSGTAALHLALLAVGCGPGDEVILPSLTFVAAANSVRHAGATTVLADIRGPVDLNLDPDDVRSAVTERTKAILVLHYGGHPCDMDAVGAIAEENDLVLIEDAAHAPGARWRERPCGSIGAAGCFSFFANKNLPVGEGGMVVTDEDDIAARVRLLRSHGMTTLTLDRLRGHAAAYDVAVEGFNYRLDEVRAAIGMVQLERLAGYNDARRRLLARYREGIGTIAGVTMPFDGAPAHSEAAAHLAVVVLPEGIDRADVRRRMLEAGIQTSVHYPPIHTFSAYADVASARPLTRTDEVAGRLLTLPLFPHMRDEQVEAVLEALRAALE